MEPLVMPGEPRTNGQTKPAPTSAGPTQAAKLVSIATARYTLGRASTGEPFAVANEGAYVPRLLRGGQDSMRAELAAEFNREHGTVPSSSALADALLVLEGRAQRVAPTDLGLRVAAHSGGIVLDLGTPEGEVVIVTPAGWWILDRSPVLFRRTALTGPLPRPVAGGDLDELRRLVNVAGGSWPLLVGWLVAALVPNMPHPIALLTGEQGAGKTTAGRMLNTIIDPSPAPLRSSPKDDEAWAVAAAGSWVVSVDNISTIPPWLSDALCRAVTGDGLVRRRLYTDADLSVLAIRRVILLTSIDAGALRGDLADRLLTIELERIEPDQRREDDILRKDFDAAHPRILGALLDLLAQVLAVWPGIRPAQLPRMADFGRVLACVDEVTGWRSLDAYRGLAQRVAADVLEADPVAVALRTFWEGRDGQSWAGEASTLLEAITPTHPPKGWPADASRFGSRLKRVAPVLRSIGLDVDSRRTNGRRIVELRAVTLAVTLAVTVATFDDLSVPASVTVEAGEGAGEAIDSDARDALDAETPLSPSPVLGEEGGKGEREGHLASTASLASNGACEPPGWLDDPDEADGEC